MNFENLEDLIKQNQKKTGVFRELDQSFTRTEETANYQPDHTSEKSWQAIRDECVSGGALDENCNIIAASLGTGKLEVVQKRLACGCILVPEDSEEIIL